MKVKEKIVIQRKPRMSGHAAARGDQRQPEVEAADGAPSRRGNQGGGVKS